MKAPVFDRQAPKKTVSLSVNSDLVAKAKAEGLNISAVAEEALIRAVSDHMREKMKAEIQRDMVAYNDYIERFGSPTEALRNHLSSLDDAV